MDGAVEVPIADTISAAVEAIMEPSARTHTRSEDSIARAFDDLTEEPPRKYEGTLPTADELARKRPPTPPAMSDITEAPDDAGEFATTSPLRVLFRLMTARATGLLVVAIGGIKKEIYVRDGQPEYVSSNVASELFGNYPRDARACSATASSAMACSRRCRTTAASSATRSSGWGS